MGSFPPSKIRWSMDFFYPNFQNDMWRIIGLIYFDDKQHFIVEGEKRFDKEKIVAFLNKVGIAIFDTAMQIKRTTGTASDADLQVVKPTNIAELLQKIPQCKTIITTGGKATEECAAQLSCKIPAVGSYELGKCNGETIKLYRLPSSSRAYPLKLEKKAEIY